MMCCCFLLLLTLTSCVCEPTFVVKVTQSSYQAEENHSITLDWTFNTQGSLDSLIVFCELFTDDHKESKVLYHLHEGVEAPESQDEQFSGRVQCDRDVLREGRVRLHVSRLRTEDSGWYLCEVLNEYGGGSDTCRLKVTAAADQHETQRATERPGPETPAAETPAPETPGPQGPGPETPAPESQERTVLYVVLGLVLAAAVTVPLVRRCRSSAHRSRDQTSVLQRTDFPLVQTAFHCTESLT